MKIIKFSAVWCNPCKAYHQEFIKAKEHFKDNDSIQFIEYDMDDHSEQFEKYNIRSIPYTVIEKDDNIIASHSGTMQSSALESLIETHL